MENSNNNTIRLYDPNYDVILTKEEYLNSIDQIIQLVEENKKLKEKLDLAVKVTEELVNGSI